MTPVEGLLSNPEYGVNYMTKSIRILASFLLALSLFGNLAWAEEGKPQKVV